MDWIFDHFQIVVLIAIVLGSVAKQFLEAKAAERRAREERDTEGDIFDPGEDWEPPRQPAPSVPPPLMRTSPPPLARQAGPPPLVSESETILKRQQEMQERLRQIKDAKRAATPDPVTRTRKKQAVTTASPSLRGALRHPREIRRAIVMREILGPPLGLR